MLVEDCDREHYYQRRPHGTLGYLIPVELAEVEKLLDQTPGLRVRAEELESVLVLSS
jgi:hypothetical protein